MNKTKSSQKFENEQGEKLTHVLLWKVSNHVRDFESGGRDVHYVESRDTFPHRGMQRRQII